MSQIRDTMEQKLIHGSNSPYNSSLWIFEKKFYNSRDKKLRIIVDYRKLFPI